MPAMPGKTKSGSKLGKEKAEQRWEVVSEFFAKHAAKFAIDGLYKDAGLPAASVIYIQVLLKVFLINLIFIAGFLVLFERYPSFDRFTAIKLALYCVLYEALGFSCGAGWLGFKWPNLFPKFWALTHLGTIKVPMFHKQLSMFRDWKHFIIIWSYFGTLLYSIVFIDDSNINGSYSVPMIGGFLLFFMITDRNLFLSSRPEYYGYYLMCLYFDHGWLTGCRVLQMMVWFWAGFSKLGVWFDYVYPGMVASNGMFGPFTNFKKSLFRSFPKDLRPSGLAVANARFGTVLEIASALLMISSSTRTMGIGCSLLLHNYIFWNFPPGHVNEWNLMNMLASVSLFGMTLTEYPIDWLTDLLDMDWRLKALLTYLIVILPLIGNLWPWVYSFLLSYRYYAGNWEYAYIIIQRDVWNDIVRPSLSKKCVNSLDHQKNHSLYRGLGWRVVGNPIGKSILEILHTLVCDFGHLFNYLDPQDYVYLDCEFLAGAFYGWDFGDGQLYGLNMLHAINQCVAQSDGKEVHKGIKQYDIIHIYVNAIPVFGSEFDWCVSDKNGKTITDGTYDVYKDIHNKPTFRTHK